MRILQSCPSLLVHVDLAAQGNPSGGTCQIALWVVANTCSVNAIATVSPYRQMKGWDYPRKLLAYAHSSGGAWIPRTSCTEHRLARWAGSHRSYSPLWQRSIRTACTASAGQPTIFITTKLNNDLKSGPENITYFYGQEKSCSGSEN